MDDEQHDVGRPDDGFTLIELLVVVIVIGILAGVAVPAYLQQRQRGYDTAARADLRNLAGLQEQRLHDQGAYATGAVLDNPEGAVKVSAQVRLRVVAFDPVGGYCLAAAHEATGNTWFYDSGEGGLQPPGTAGCPTTYSTSDGVPIG